MLQNGQIKLLGKDSEWGKSPRKGLIEYNIILTAYELIKNHLYNKFDQTQILA